ncbi:MAG: hypothetical protein M3458_11270 [Acidobacteriota bacterium]|nr:hypothetical protein [Acidobacteriota bacterium]
MKLLKETAKVIKAMAILIITLLCAIANFSQTRRGTQPARASLKPGYYFTIDMCRACYYPNWPKDLHRLFQDKKMNATTYEGALMETPRERFVAMKIFPRRGLWKDIVYVGPFASEEAAIKALEEFPAVLGVVQKKRNRMGSAAGEDWPLSEGEKVELGAGNNYRYEFNEIKGCKLVG